MKVVRDVLADTRPETRLIYEASEYSFLMKPILSFSSVLINDLNLEVDEAGRLISVWGFCPHTNWIEASLSLPNFVASGVRFVDQSPFSRGVSVRLNPAKAWPVKIDRRNGWIMLEEDNSVDELREATIVLQPFAGAAVEISSVGDLRKVWLKPEALPAA